MKKIGIRNSSRDNLTGHSSGSSRFFTGEERRGSTDDSEVVARRATTKERIASQALSDDEEESSQQEAYRSKQDPQNTRADIEYFESTLQELLELAKKPHRKDQDVARAKQLMRVLRLMGFSSRDIEQLTGGAWSYPTVKQYTAGVEPTEEDVKGNLANILVRASSRDLGLLDVLHVVELEESLNKKGATIEQAAAVVEEVRKLGEEFSPDIFKQIARALQQFGGLRNTLEAISSFGNLKDIQDKVAKEDEKCRTWHAQAEQYQKKVEEAQPRLNLYQALETKGYNIDYMQKFDQFVRKYGRGKLMSEQFLEQAVSRYSSVEDISAREAELRGKVGEAEAKLRRLQIDHASYARSIDLCHDLLFKYKLSPEVIKRMHKELEVYGGVPGFLDALEKFRGMEELENKIHTLRATITHLRSEQEQRTISLQEVTGKLDGAAQFHQALAGTVVEQMKRQAEQSIQEVRKKASEEIARMELASRKYAEVMAKTKTLEEELKIARYVTSVAKYPEEARGLPAEWGYIFIMAGLRFVQANNINPSASGFPAELVAKHPDLKLFGFQTFTLQEILAWAVIIAATDAGRLT